MNEIKDKVKHSHKSGLYYSDSDELCEKIAKQNNGIALLRFSCGKDAIGAWLQMKRYFHTIIPIYHYIHPHLNFIEDSLKYYEDFFGAKIYRVPNSATYHHLTTGLYQTKESWQNIRDFHLRTFDNDDINDSIKEEEGIDNSVLTGIGVRAADSLNRQLSIKKYGAVNENRQTFFPVYDWNMERLYDEIVKAGVKLPIDYKIWGKSFDGLDYRFIKPLKDHFPDDYERLKELFPLIDVELKRYNLNG